MPVLGVSAAVSEIEAQLARVAASDSSVLITGETGTGKERVATAIHGYSRRRERPFIAINCAAIPLNLLESELFGHERGAYTGAFGAHPGKLKLADGGSVFLDEIGDMAESAQAKLLRAIETREVWRVGGSRGVPIDVRFIAATNTDLEAAAGTSSIRADLYYRLNVVRLHLPPLRERSEDIPLLLAAFVCEYNRRFARDVRGFTPEILRLCLVYRWPGNVRELRNFVEATFVFSSRQSFGVEDLAPPWRTRLDRGPSVFPSERARVLAALVQANGNKTRAALDLRCSRMTLYRQLRKYQLNTA